MTRLEATSEPSMEDILASIRKIISEDPPGSRPVPPAQRPQQQAASSFGSSFERSAPVKEPRFESEPRFEPEARSEPEESYQPSTISLMPEPYLRATPSRAEQQGFASSNDRSFDHAHTNSRIEPAFDARSTVALPEPAYQPAGAPTSAALSVDAQLSGLLDDVVPAVAAHDLAPVPAATPATDAKPAVDFAAKLMGRPSRVEPIVAPEVASEPLELMQRPGFTVSRDGYVPSEVEPVQATGAATVVPAERDPFEFDLGPSPFQVKAAPVPARAEPVASISEPTVIAAATEPESANAATYIAPSVAATLPAFDPAPVAVSATLPEISAPASDATLQQPQATTPSAGGSEAMSAGTMSAAGSSPLAPAQAMPAVGTELSLAPQSTMSSAIQRSMEDTVADLLRPMLKTWLAENMPKIVERALRREMSERNLSEHKTAAE